MQVLAVHRVDAGVDELLRHDQALAAVGVALLRVVPVDRRHHSSTSPVVGGLKLVVGGAATGEVKLMLLLLLILLDVRVSSPLAAGAL